MTAVSFKWIDSMKRRSATTKHCLSVDECSERKQIILSGKSYFRFIFDLNLSILCLGKFNISFGTLNLKQVATNLSSQEFFLFIFNQADVDGRILNLKFRLYENNIEIKWHFIG